MITCFGQSKRISGIDFFYISLPTHVTLYKYTHTLTHTNSLPTVFPTRRGESIWQGTGSLSSLKIDKTRYLKYFKSRILNFVFTGAATRQYWCVNFVMSVKLLQVSIGNYTGGSMCVLPYSCVCVCVCVRAVESHLLSQACRNLDWDNGSPLPKMTVPSWCL